MDASSQTQEHL